VSGAQIISEPTPIELLARFGDDPKAHCFALQEAIIAGRVKQAASASGPMQVRDRGPDEDFAVFATMFHTAGYLSDSQFARIRQLSKEASASMGKDDAVIMLTAENRVLEQRIMAAGAPSPVVSMLPAQRLLYEQWHGLLSVPRVFIDTSYLQERDLEQRAPWLVDSLYNVIAGKFSRNDAFGLIWKN
jgi:deoxyadenosine/deoxycytidine kinase